MLSPRTGFVVVVLLSAAVSLPTPLRAQFTPPGTNPSMSGERGFGNSPMSGDSHMRTTLTGAVRLPNNRPIGDARVEVRDIGNGSTVASTYTNPAGNFEIRDLAPGVYELIVTHGVAETRERVDARMDTYNVNIHLMDPQMMEAAAGGTTVSVENLKVPGKAKNAVHKAEELLQKNRIDDAKKEVQKALDVYPTYGAAYTVLGIISLDQQDTAGAIANLEKSIQYDPNTALPYIVLGATYNSMQRFDDALRSLNSGVRLAPQSWQGYFEMAKANMGKAQFAEALQLVTKAEELGGRNYLPIHLVKAHALVGTKEYNKAAAELELYISRDPQSATATAARHELDQVKAFTSNK